MGKFANFLLLPPGPTHGPDYVTLDNVVFAKESDGVYRQGTHTITRRSDLSLTAMSPYKYLYTDKSGDYRKYYSNSQFMIQ